MSYPTRQYWQCNECKFQHLKKPERQCGNIFNKFSHTKFRNKYNLQKTDVEIDILLMSDDIKYKNYFDCYDTIFCNSLLYTLKIWVPPSNIPTLSLKQRTQLGVVGFITNATPGTPSTNQLVNDTQRTPSTNQLVESKQCTDELNTIIHKVSTIDLNHNMNIDSNNYGNAINQIDDIDYLDVVDADVVDADVVDTVDAMDSP